MRLNEAFYFQSLESNIYAIPVVNLGMKPLTIYLLALLVFFSCRKDHIPSEFKNKITGTWEIERFSGFGSVSFPPGNGRIIVLFANGSFERRQHDTVMFRGRYSLRTKNDCYPRDEKTFFSVNDNSYSMDSFIDVDDSGKLLLSSSNCLADGGTSFFRKI